MTEVKRLGSVEESTIQTAAFKYFASCPLIPQEVSRQYGDLNRDSIAIFAQPGSGRYLKKYVSGYYEAEFPFLLCYRAMPTTTSKRLNAEELLEKIADWMCSSEEYPQLTGGRKIIRLEMGTAYIAGKTEEGMIDYQIMMNLIYSGKDR